MKTLRHSGARRLAAACAFVVLMGLCVVALFAGSRRSCACGEEVSPREIHAPVKAFHARVAGRRT